MSDSILGADALDRNPNIDQDVLRKAHELSAKLEAFGVSVQAGYSLAPALGGHVVGRQNAGTQTVANTTLASLSSATD